MLKYKKIRIVFCGVVSIVFCVAANTYCDIHEYAGTSGAQFLKFGPGARQAAMGDAFSSVSGDAFVLCWNPALISEIDKNVFSFMHSFWLGNVFIDYAAVVIPMNIGNLGISFGYLNVGTIEKIDKTGTILSGGFTPYDIILGVSFARNIISSLNAGCTLKGMISSSEPRDDWCRVESTTPNMVKTSVIFIARLRTFFKPSHSKGAGVNSRKRTVR